MCMGNGETIMILLYDNLPDTIWGEMYGRPCTDPDAIIIDIKN